jgi:hypothetical protein
LVLYQKKNLDQILVLYQKKNLGSNIGSVSKENRSQGSKIKQEGKVPNIDKKANGSRIKHSDTELDLSKLSLDNTKAKNSSRHLSLCLNLDSLNSIEQKKTKSLSLHSIDDFSDFETIRDRCVETWENKHVLIWLRHIGLQEYSEAFIEKISPDLH